MAHHTLTLNYGPDGFKPDQDPLPIKQGDTISFQLGQAPPNSKFKITMQDTSLFSPAEAESPATKITVLKAGTTRYDCQLFDSDNNLLVASGTHQSGGGFRPG